MLHPVYKVVPYFELQKYQHGEDRSNRLGQLEINSLAQDLEISKKILSNS